MFIGHQNQWNFLKRSVALNRISHAYLFCGQEHLGKKTLASQFINLINNQEIRKDCNPDFILIEPQNNEIKVSQIRELIWRLSLKPVILLFKSAIINDAHLMNQEAQTALLKTLEEPKGKTVLVLITEYPGMLFPTILSRVTKIKFYPVKKKEIKDYLKENLSFNQRKKGKLSEEILEKSLGRPGVAIDFLLNPKKIDEEEKMIEELIRLKDSNLAFRFQYIKSLLDKKINLKEIFDIWLKYFRNVLLSKIKKDSISASLNNYSFSKLKNIIRLLEKIEFLLSKTRVNQRLALEILMLEL